MKKTIALLIAVLLTISLFGCAADEEVNTTSTATQASMEVTSTPKATVTQEEVTNTSEMTITEVTQEITNTIELTSTVPQTSTIKPTQTVTPKKSTSKPTTAKPTTVKPSTPKATAPKPTTAKPTATPIPKPKLSLPSLPIFFHGDESSDLVLYAQITKLEYDNSGNLNIFLKNLSFKNYGLGDNKQEQRLTIYYKIYDVDGVVIHNGSCSYKLAKDETGKDYIPSFLLEGGARIEFPDEIFGY